MPPHATVRAALTEKSAGGECWAGGAGEGALLHRWWEGKLVRPLQKQYGSSLKTGVTVWSSSPTSGHTSGKKTLIWKDTCTPIVWAARFIIAKKRKQPKCPSTDEWIKKMWSIYSMESYSAVKREWNNAIPATWTDLEIIMLSKSNKDMHQMIPLIVGIWNVMQMVLFSKQTHRHRKQTVVTKGRRGGRVNQEFGISWYKLLFIKYNIQATRSYLATQVTIFSILQ